MTLLSFPKKYIFPGFFLLVFIPIFGQTTSVQWGPGFSSPAQTTFTKVVSWDRQGFFSLREKNVSNYKGPQKVILERFNNQLELVKSNTIGLKHKGKERTFEEMLKLNGKLYFFTAYHNRQHRKNYLFYQTVSKKTLTPSKQLTKIGELVTYSGNDGGDFGIQVSSDSSYLLACAEFPGKKNTPAQFAFFVFDDNLQLKWEKKVLLPYSHNRFNIEDYRIDQNGNVYLLGVLFEDNQRNRRQGAPTYKYIVLEYRENGSEVREYPINLRDKFITDLTFRIGNQDDLICAGFYSEKNSYSIKGSCYIRIGLESQNIISSGVQAFDFEFLTEYLSLRKKEKAKKAEITGNTRKQAELYNYDLKHLILRTDGGAVLIAEQYFTERREEYDYFTNRFFVNYFYNYNDIIVINIQPSGDIEWVARVPKKQVSQNDGGYFSSYSMITASDRLMFLYNDNINNFNSGNRRATSFGRRNGIVNLTSVKKGGKLSSSPLTILPQNGEIVRPKVCRQVGRNRMLLYSESGRNYRFGWLNF